MSMGSPSRAAQIIKDSGLNENLNWQIGYLRAAIETLCHELQPQFAPTSGSLEVCIDGMPYTVEYGTDDDDGIRAIFLGNVDVMEILSEDIRSAIELAFEQGIEERNRSDLESMQADDFVLCAQEAA